MPHAHAVYSSINRPLTIGGAERRLFFAAVVAGGATFAMGSLFGGLLMFLALYAGARWTTQHDPQLLRIVLRSTSARRYYDPGKLAPLILRRQE